MKSVDLDKLPVSAPTRTTLAGMAHVDGCLVSRDRTLVYGPGCDFETLETAVAAFPTATHHWHRAEPVAGTSKVEQALALIATGLTANAAAQKVGVNSSAVYRAQSRRAERGTCPHCGQLLPR